MAQLEHFHKICLGLVEEAWGPKDRWYADTTPSFGLWEPESWNVPYMAYISNSGNSSSSIYEFGSYYVVFVGSDHSSFLDHESKREEERLAELKKLGFTIIINRDEAEVFLKTAARHLWPSLSCEEVIQEAGIRNFAS